MYLLDTNVISELRRQRPHGAVLAWLASVQDASLHLSVVTVGEIQAGIEITRDRDPERAVSIEAWLDQVMDTWNVLPIDGRIYRRWARLMHRRPAALAEDALIAATASVHGLAVVTRNLKDFESLDVAAFDPFVFPRAEG